MKKLFFISAIILSTIFTSNAQENSYTLTVNISGLNSDDGTIMIGLYTSKENFLKKRFRGVVTTIKNKKSVAVFKDIPKGEYAVSFVHDENNNKKMDTNFLGIPKEDYGCSNNATGFMGPPKYNDAKFQLSENKEINIEI